MVPQKKDIQKYARQNAEHIFAVFFYLSPLEGIGDFTGFTIAVNVDIAGSTATTAGTED